MAHKGFPKQETDRVQLADTAQNRRDVGAVRARGADGKFYLYYTLKLQIYVGVADHPMGPFRKLMPDGQPEVWAVGMENIRKNGKLI